jgi:hypothetical protein
MTTVSASASASGPCSASTWNPASVRTRPAVHRADDDVVQRLPVGVLGGSEDPWRDAHLEGVHAVQREDGDAVSSAA